MCFGGQTVTPPSNPAPYSLDNSQSAVTETVKPVGSTPLSPQAALKDQQDIQQQSTQPGLSVGMM